MTKVIKSLQTNEDEQKNKNITVVLPDYVVAFGVQAIIALLAEYDYFNDEEKQSHSKSAIELLSYLSPNLSEIYKF